MTGNKAVAEQQRAGVEKAIEKGSVKSAAAPHEKRRALGRGLESLLPRVFKAEESGVGSRESESRLQASGVRLQQAGVESPPATESRSGTAATVIENPSSTEDTKGNEGNREPESRLQASGVGLQHGEAGLGTATAVMENPLATEGPERSQESGIGSAESAVVGSRPAAAASIENPLTAKDTKRHEGNRESESRLQALGAGLQQAESGAAVGSPVPGVILELQAQVERREVLRQLPLDVIDPNPYQTRVFTKTSDEDEAGMKELVASIKATGVITPILVRPGKDGRYTLIAGERRTKASRQAGRETIPAIVREVSNQQAAELTVIENLQRENLNCMDQANAFVMLSQNFQMTQDQIGTRVGMSRGTVSNYMRLVRLPEEIQRYLTMNQLTYSHARELLNLEDSQIILKVARRAVKEMMSVEQLEKLIMDEEFGGRRKLAQLAPGRARWVDPNVRAAQRDLERVLGVKVRIRDRKGKGKITIEYATLEDYDRVIGMLRGKQ